MSLLYKFFPAFCNLFSADDEQRCRDIDRLTQDPLLHFAGFDFELLRPQLEKAVNDFTLDEKAKRLCKRKTFSLSPSSDQGLFQQSQLSGSTRHLVAASANPLQKSNRGRSDIDPVMMFKICVIAQRFNISNKRVAVEIMDRTTFRRFLDVGTCRLPAPQTIWRYFEIFTKKGCFERFSSMLADFISQHPISEKDDSRAIDSTFCEVPKSHNTSEENKIIKKGLGHTLWNDKPAKKRQKDIDARGAMKGNVYHFGYKGHFKVSTTSKLIAKVYVTDASVHDSKVISPLLDKTDNGKKLYADAGYAGQAQEQIIRQFGMIPNVCERAYRGHPLSETQKQNNRIKSSVRCTVEHCFGFVTGSMGDFKIRSIGIDRAKARINLIAFIYNLCRLDCLFNKMEFEKDKFSFHQFILPQSGIP